MNCIIGVSNLVLQSHTSNLDSEVAGSMQMISTSGDLLLAIVNDILDYSKLSCDKANLSKSSQALRNTVSTVISSLEVKAQKNGLDLRLNIAPNIPLSIETDHRRIQQILYNLVGNAVKFGASGNYVELSIHKVVTDGKEMLRFSVIDQGPGISEEELENIFLPFQQAKVDTNRYIASRSESGTGLGLSITHKLVEALGGEITVDSKVGEGCGFHFTLPLEYSKSTEAGTLTPANEGSSGYPSKQIEDISILVCDDNKINQKVAKRTVERLGIKKVDLASDGQQAVDMSSSKSYDLILMDLQMPVMDGLEATRIITGRQTYPKIIFVTAHAGPVFERQTREAGGTGYVTKPFKLDDMKEALRCIC